MTAPVLSDRMLNRALLARQMLLERADISVIEAIEQLVGMQSQAPNPPYIGLWTRLRESPFHTLSSLMTSRHAVRIALMRSTIHLVSAHDCSALRSFVQPALEKAFAGGYGKNFADVDYQQVAAVGKTLVEQKPHTFAELGNALQQDWPHHDAHALSQLVRAFVPLVQVPPRGVWNASGPAAHTSAEAWLDTSPQAETTADAVILRYLKTFGPASVADMQRWSGLTGLRAVVARLSPHLRMFHSENGVELWDIPNGELPDESVTAPVRFIPEFDNLLLSHAVRTRIITEEYRKRVFTVNGIIRATILVDGFVHGTWRITSKKEVSTLEITPFTSLTTANIQALTHEGAALLTATNPTHSHEITFMAV